MLEAAMSEVASYETTVQIPSLAQRTSLDRQVVDGEPRAALLMRALELVTEDHGGEISRTIVDCEGKQIPCLVEFAPAISPMAWV